MSGPSEFTNRTEQTVWAHRGDTGWHWGVRAADGSRAVGGCVPFKWQAAECIRDAREELADE